MKKLIEMHAAAAATLNIEIGFKPDFVLIINQTDLTELEITRRELDALSGVASTGLARDANGAKTRETLTASGISDYDGNAPTETDPADVEVDAYGNQLYPSDSAKLGITLGANATVNDHAADHLLVYAETYDEIVDAL